MEIHIGWHRWFAWYPVRAMMKNGRYRWVWLWVVNRNVTKFITLQRRGKTLLDGISTDYKL